MQILDNMVTFYVRYQSIHDDPGTNFRGYQGTMVLSGFGRQAQHGDKNTQILRDNYNDIKQWQSPLANDDVKPTSYATPNTSTISFEHTGAEETKVKREGRGSAPSPTTHWSQGQVQISSFALGQKRLMTICCVSKAFFNLWSSSNVYHLIPSSQQSHDAPRHEQPHSSGEEVKDGGDVVAAKQYQAGSNLLSQDCPVAARCLGSVVIQWLCLGFALACQSQIKTWFSSFINFRRIRTLSLHSLYPQLRGWQTKADGSNLSANHVL